MFRLSKTLCVAAIALYSLLVGLGNAADYWSNFPAVEQVLEMKNIFPGSTIAYRAVNTPALHHAGYVTLLSLEFITGVLCAWGALNMFRLRKSEASVFNHSKQFAVAGLTLGFLTWQVIFMSIGGEWFGMWMFAPFNGILAKAFQIFITILTILIYVSHRDD